MNERARQVGVDRETLPVAAATDNTTHRPDGGPEKDVDALPPELGAHFLCPAEGEPLVPAGQESEWRHDVPLRRNVTYLAPTWMPAG